MFYSRTSSLQWPLFLFRWKFNLSTAAIYAQRPLKWPVNQPWKNIETTFYIKMVIKLDPYVRRWSLFFVWFLFLVLFVCLFVLFCFVFLANRKLEARALYTPVPFLTMFAKLSVGENTETTNNDDFINANA